MPYLHISFPDQSKAFTYGVEYGRLLEKMERGDHEVKNNGFPIRVENKALIAKTCDSYGYNAMFSECETEGWVNFKAVKGVN